MESLISEELDQNPNRNLALNENKCDEYFVENESKSEKLEMLECSFTFLDKNKRR